jgi:PAS domain S-box-containing protein
MSEPDAPAARKAAPQTDSGLASAADSDPRHAVATRFGAAVAAVFVIVLLVGVAALLAWRAAPVGAAWGVAGASASLLLGGLALTLLRRLMKNADRDAQALGAFAARLRSGDVAGALRAVRAEAPGAISVWGQPSGAAGRESASAPSQFDQQAHEVEVALGAREQRWQARMRLSADWHWETDTDLRVTWVSQDLASLVKLGVQPADLIGQRLDAVPLFEPPEGGWAPIVERTAQRKALRDVVIEVRRRGRSPVWVALNGRAHFDDGGQFTGYEGVGRDVTDERIAYLRLAESERRHSMMAELASDWYWHTDEAHRIDEVGPVARQLVGSRIDQVMGRTRWEAFPDGASPGEWDAHRADLDARRPFRGFEFALRQGGQTLRWVSVSGLPRFDARQAFIGYHGVGRDITLKKRAERLLLTRNEQLERLVAVRTSELEQNNRDLEAFARQLAHELRTPISQVVGLTDLLKSAAWPRLEGGEREWLRLAGQSAREMSHTVTALLELARSTSTALLLEPVDLSALAESVIAELPWLERAAPVDWRVEPGLVAHCSAPLARVVLTNLLGNAAKFTRDVAAPRVELAREPSQDGAFFVQDNGAGFDAERADTLFQPFVRLHRSDQFQGTGLGLSIVRRIIERHGGSISAQGEVGQGARFVLRFSPARAVEAAPQQFGFTDSAHGAAA